MTLFDKVPGASKTTKRKINAMSDVGVLDRGDTITEIIDINEQANAGPCPNCNGEPRLQVEKTPGRKKLESWLNKNMKIEMTDGRTLLGIFLCTDRDRNVILGSCSEYLKPDDDGAEEEPRVLGLAMVPGHHIVSIHIDDTSSINSDIL